jgi:hypothetical protein
VAQLSVERGSSSQTTVPKFLPLWPDWDRYIDALIAMAMEKAEEDDKQA